MTTNGTQSVVRTDTLAPREDQNALPESELRAEASEKEYAEQSGATPPPPRQRRNKRTGATATTSKKGELADADLIALGKLTLNANRASMTPESYIKALKDIAEDLHILKLDAIAALVHAEIDALGRAAKLMVTATTAPEA